MPGTATSRISPTIQRIIERTRDEFSEDIVKLSDNLSTSVRGGTPIFTRGDFTAALAGDQDIIEMMRLHAVRKEWIRKDDNESIPRALERIRLLRA